ncbi:MAG: heme-binding protein, partial [Actinobacteria bacterium]|nr:heme-binding protein [Actinomycetota bacterium]
EELRAALTKEGLTPIGALRIARFDPPWKPGLLRYNEVILDIKP